MPPQTSQPTPQAAPQNNGVLSPQQIQQYRTSLNLNPSNPLTPSTTQTAQDQWGNFDSIVNGKSSSAAPAAPAQSSSLIANPFKQIGQAGSNVINDTNKNAENIVQDLTPSNNKNLSDVATNALDVGGSVASEVGSFLGNGLNLLVQVTTPKPVYDAITSHLQNAIQSVAGTPQAQGILKQWNGFEAQHPEAAKNIGNAINIGALIGGGEASPTAEEAGNAVKQGAKAAGNMVGDAASGVAKGVGEAVAPVVKAPINMAQDLATPIDQNVKTILKNPLAQTEDTLHSMFNQAKKAVSETGAATPFDTAGKNTLGNAMDSLKSKLSDAGDTMQKSLVENGSKTVDTSAVQQSFKDGLEKRLGTTLDDSGNLADAEGRKSIIANSPSDAKMVKMAQNAIDGLGSNPTVQKVNDVVDSLQSELYKAPQQGAEAINNNTKGFIKQIVGQLNGEAKEIAGPEYSAANDTYSNLKKLQGDLNKRLGSNMKNAGSIMKRIFSPQDGGTKTLISQLEKETGQPIFHDATLAKFAMDAVGDPRAQSLLQQGLETKSKGVLQSALDYVQGKLENPEGVATRIIQKAQGADDRGGFIDFGGEGKNFDPKKFIKAEQPPAGFLDELSKFTDYLASGNKDYGYEADFRDMLSKYGINPNQTNAKLRNIATQILDQAKYSEVNG